MQQRVVQFVAEMKVFKVGFYGWVEAAEAEAKAQVEAESSAYYKNRYNCNHLVNLS